MKTCATVAALSLASASAFVQPNAFIGSVVKHTAPKSTSAMKMEFAGGMLGADGPEPNSKNFDPFKMAENNPENLLFYREAELKHGRICMLATVGMVAPDYFRLPGEMYQGLGVVEAHNAMVEKGPMVQLLFWISLVEILTMPTIFDMDKKDRAPGDFALDPLKLLKDPVKADRFRVAELKNGRLAMMAFSGMITQAALTGHGFPFLY